MGAKTAGEILGAADCDELCAAHAGAGPGARSPRASRSDLRLVYRGLRHARSEGSEGAAGASRCMSEVRKWLEAIGLAQYAEAFEANNIEADLLGQVEDQTLKDIGVSSA